MKFEQAIINYIPKTKDEQEIKEEILTYINLYPKTILTRDNEDMHITSSGFILNPRKDKTLMVYHNIFQSFSWTGGHADGEEDLLYVAMKEAREETGIQMSDPFSEEIIGLDILPVKKHIKNGKIVKEHLHLSVAYGLIVEESQSILPNLKENSQVKWISVNELEDYCEEKEMIPIYKRLISRMRCGMEEKQDLELGQIISPLLKWYDKHARSLPWRDHPTAYKVWVSEIMLQQTRVEAVKPYFAHFMRELPTLEKLANAPEGQLLKLWEGLGYYNRVRNLQKAAQIIMERLNGEIPCNYEQLIELPGIGEYTAGAISSIAFGAANPAVDGNVMRVIARITENWGDITKTKIKKEMTMALKEIYPLRRSGDFTQSLMELGATICTPNGLPKCKICPLSFLCKAYKNESILDLPIKSKKKPRKKEEKTVFILCYQNKIAMKQRAETGLLSRLWEFPNVDGNLDENQVSNQLEDWNISARKVTKSVDSKHIFTHIEWRMTSYMVICDKAIENFTWATREKIGEEIALPSAFKPFYDVLLGL